MPPAKCMCVQLAAFVSVWRYQQLCCMVHAMKNWFWFAIVKITRGKWMGETDITDY